MPQALPDSASQTDRSGTRWYRIQSERATLVEALKADSEQTRAGAANAIAAMSPHSGIQPSSPLNECLTDSSIIVRTAAINALAINALASQNGNSQEWVSKLETLAVDAQPAIRQAALVALDGTDDTEASLEVFVDRLSDDDETVRLAAAVALGRSGNASHISTGAPAIHS